MMASAGIASLSRKFTASQGAMQILETADREMFSQNQTDRLVAAPLTRRHIDQAYTLVQLALPAIDVIHWRGYARWHMRRPNESGILAAWDRRGHIFGLANYLRQVSLAQGPILVSDQMITVDMVNPNQVSDLLFSALTRITDDLGCNQLQCRMDRAGQVRGPN
jgi:hypothetical protein